MIGRSRMEPRRHGKLRNLRRTGRSFSESRPDAWFHALAGSVAGGVIALDGSGRIQAFNAGAESMTGFAADEVLGRPLHPLLLDSPLPDARLDGAPGPTGPCTAGVRTRQGTLRPVTLRTIGAGTPALPAGGTVVILEDLAPAGAARHDPREPVAERSIGRHWLWETDAAHRIAHVSDDFSAATGCPAADLLGMPVEKLALLFGNEPAWQDLRDALERQEPIEGQRLRVRETGGAYRLFCISGRPLRLAGGAFCGFHGVICDITAPTRAHQEEQCRSDRLLAAAEDCAAGLTLFDPAGRLAVHNKAFAALFFPDAVSTVRPGMTYEAFARAYIEAHLGINRPDSVRECVALELVRHRKGGGPVLRRLADGRWVCTLDTPLPDGSVIGVHVDISGFMSREIACRDRDRHLLGIVNHLAGAIVTTDLDGTIDFVNAAALRLFGYAAHEVVGRPIGMLIPDRPHPAVEPLRAPGAVPSARPCGAGAGVFAAMGRRKDGSVLEIEVMRSEIRMGAECRLLRVIRDLGPARQPSGGTAARSLLHSDLVA